MNLKTLGKKIRKLEARLLEGPQKLARLKRKFEAGKRAKARKANQKSAARAIAARQSAQASALTQKKKEGSTAQAPAKAASVQKRTPVRKAKRKLNLSPERRAQLAAAMKARWAAKRAALEGTSEKASPGQASVSGEEPRTS
jgi:hypothetical protein